MSYKIGILIPSTTKGLKCKSYVDAYFYKIFLRSFIKTYDKDFNGKLLTYCIYMIIDDDDEIYSNKKNIKKLVSFIALIKNINIQFISSKGISKGWVTKMWNKAFKKAYNDGCDYFYQCGDDIEFLDKGWVNKSIRVLLARKNIGVTGPIDWGRELFKQKYKCEQKFLLTQTFVSRKHMDFFGFYFPEEIKNWYCDDWITYVYASKKKCYPISSYRIHNKGGDPRYEPTGKNNPLEMTILCNNLIEKYNKKIK